MALGVLNILHPYGLDKQLSMIINALRWGLGNIGKLSMVEQINHRGGAIWHTPSIKLPN